MKDYYEVLEVSRTASKEIIDKAYRVLAKKYHPDLQEAGQKQNAEKMMKEINEAYEILSDEQKRQEYDNELKYKEEQETLKKQRQQEQNIPHEIQNQYKEYNNNSQDYNQYGNPNNNANTYNEQYNNYQEQPLTKEQIKAQRKAEKKAREEYIEEQERVYRNFYRSLGYKVKERWTWKRFKRLLSAIGVILLVALIMWIFPPTHKLLVEAYEDNAIIRAIIQVIVNIFKGLGQGLGKFFKGIFAK